MQIIAILPVRNESWILDRTLRTLFSFCDRVIVADQHSTDGTREILSKYSDKVAIIDNPEEGHSTRVRWRLLEMAREYDGNNLLMLSDADEIFSANISNPEILNRLTDVKPATGIEFPWIQLWRSPFYYRNDSSAWGNNRVLCAFRDDRNVRYGDIYLPNDHNERIPHCQTIMKLEAPKVLHFQFVLFNRMLSKQRWYRVREALELGAVQAQNINLFYACTKDERGIRIERIPEEWIALWKKLGIDLEHFQEAPLYWYDIEILKYFALHGVDHFSELDIWDTDWEAKRKLAISMGSDGVSGSMISDPRTSEQRLYHTYINRFFRPPPWREPRQLMKLPFRWLRSAIRAAGLKRVMIP